MTAADFWCEREAPTAEELFADEAATLARGERWTHVVAGAPLDPYRPGIRGTIIGEAIALVTEPDGTRYTAPVVRAMWRGPRNTVWADATTPAEALEELAAGRQRWGCADDDPERYPGEPVPSAKH